MKRFTLSLLATSLLCLSGASASAQPSERFELRDGDRVVFLGDVLMEREQTYGHIETELTIRFPDDNVTFRNLGWSGDTPGGIARAGLSLLQAGKEPADEGFQQLKKQLDLVKPTVVFLGYGMADSLDENTTLAEFEKGMNTLMDAIKDRPGAAKTRFVVLSPIWHENLGAPWPDPTAHNAKLAKFTKSLEQLADKRDAWFVNLFKAVKDDPNAPLTQDGIHLSGFGYKRAAETVGRELRLQSMGRRRILKAVQINALRKLIIEKNELFFHRSRPENMAYILGFRKREQGQNAVEIPQFDPLIEKGDLKISLVRKLDASENFLRRFEKKMEPVKDTFSATPQEELNFTVHEDFEVNLFAENPHLAKPIQINFDPQGRLWVASSAIYPQIEPGQDARDSIILIEDTDRDGTADKSTVFAEGLLIPTAVAPGDGGVYVGQSTELLHFRDTDGDGKADQKKIVFSGFGTEDTHHTIHTLRWGLDGRLYFNQSIYIRSHLETPHGMVRLSSGGIFRTRTADLKTEILARGFVNSWGHQFDAYGQSFATDGAGAWGINYVIPDARYITYAGARRIMDSISPGNYPKFASLEIVASKHFPDDWQGDLITCDFRAHRIVRFKVEEEGAGFVTKEMPDLLRTANATFRPIDVKFGPDGALYIADWSNKIIQHGEVDFRDERRDHKHGRIWRISHKKRPVNKVPDLAKLKNDALLNRLLSPNEFERRRASRVLTERGVVIAKDLKRWTAKRKNDHDRLRALWMHQAIEQVDGQLLEQLLKSEDGRIRAAAIRVLVDWMDRIDNESELLAGLAADEHPRVRLEAVRALGKIPTLDSVNNALGALDQPMDRFLDYGLWLTVNELSETWLGAVKDGSWKPEGNDKALAFALKSIKPEQSKQVLARLLPAELPKNGEGPWIEIIGQSGGASELRQLFDQTVKGGLNAEAATRSLKALGEAARLRKLRPSGSLDAVGEIFKHDNAAVGAAAIRLAGIWKLGKSIGAMLDSAGNADARPELRQAAFDGLRSIGGQGAIKGLGSIADKHAGTASGRQAATVLASLNFGASRNRILKVLAATKDDNDAQTLWRSLLNVKNAGKGLALKMSDFPPPENVARAGLRIAREGSRNEPELIAALTAFAGALPSAADISPEDLKKFIANVSTKGDPARGERVYRRQSMACVACHAIGGVGGLVGPDMTSIGASAPIDYLVESLLKPNDKIKEGYHSITVETKDGEEYSGIIVRETKQELVLRDAGNQENSIPKNNIQQRRNGLSLMPAGLMDTLTEQERLDLARFLSELGKPGPYDASQSKVARAWKIFTVHSTNQQGDADKAAMGDLSVAGWASVNSTVVGGLLKDDLTPILERWQRRGIIEVYAATRFQLAQKGTVKFELEAPAGSQVVIDGKTVGKGPSVSADLDAGEHIIVVKLDHRALPDQVRLKSNDVTFISN
ncbi:MAG: putative heme-binding domain-containing protein [Limisphaerales bacterium]|jgi:putative heme-binding domain-containing protein